MKSRLFEADRPQTAPGRQLERVLGNELIKLLDLGLGYIVASRRRVVDPERRRKTECAGQTCNNQQRKCEAVYHRHVLAAHLARLPCCNNKLNNRFTSVCGRPPM